MTATSGRTSDVGQAELAEAAETCARIAAAVQQVIVGKPEIVRLSLVTLLSGGHLLVEDVPGVGKTSLAKALARSIDCSVSRVQFTPDLLPGDITGMSIFNQQTAEFEFRPGPVFANVVIADEINRAAPKTQSALLECMAEQQVTVDGSTYQLASPFLVVATQNPIEMDGTYPIPEAQRDRFTARVSVGYPDLAAELAMVDEHAAGDPLETLRPVTDAQQVRAIVDTVRRVQVSPEVRQYCVELVSATRRHPDLHLGASPRATLQLVRAARAQAALSGRGYVVPDDVQAVAVPVLAHRLLLSPDAAARRSPAAVVHALIGRHPGPAPTGLLSPVLAPTERAVGLSTRGRCVLAGGTATAVCAVLLDERDLLRIGAFAALLPLLALLLVTRTRRAVQARRTLLPSRLAAGTGADVELRLAGRPLLGVLRVTDTVPDAAGPDEQAPPRFAVTHIPRRDGLRLGYRLRPPLRGVHRIGPLRARATDPLGLASCTRELVGADRLVVLPRVVALRGMPVESGSGAGTAGATLARQGPGVVDVLVRPYQHGDELRRVHWRSSARHDELMVRLEERPARGGTTVLLDRRDAAHHGHGPGASLEFAISLTASIGVHLIGRGDPVTLRTEDGIELTEPGPVGRADALLDTLTALRPSAQRELTGLTPSPTSGLIAVLGALDPDGLAALLARRTGGHAVLLDTTSWLPPGPEAAAQPGSTDEAAAVLRRAGWHVVVARAGTSPQAVWAQLIRTGRTVRR